LTANPNPMAAVAVQRAVASRVLRRAARPDETRFQCESFPAQPNRENLSC
jgi:hypothetical protein